MRENGWFEVLLLLSFFLFASYTAYQYWFQLPRSYRKMKRTYEKLPEWYPLRKDALRRLKGRSWIWQARFPTALMVILSLASLLIVLGQVLFGIWK